MPYYGKPRFDRVKDLVDAEVSAGVHSLRASYLARKYDLDAALVQQLLSDLASAGDLKASYQVLCSGELQNYDVDGEFEDPGQIPRHPISCSKCGDVYIPDDSNIIVSFEPTESYLESLAQRR